MTLLVVEAMAEVLLMLTVFVDVTTFLLVVRAVTEVLFTTVVINDVN